MSWQADLVTAESFAREALEILCDLPPEEAKPLWGIAQQMEDIVLSLARINKLNADA